MVARRRENCPTTYLKKLFCSKRDPSQSFHFVRFHSQRRARSFAQVSLSSSTFSASHLLHFGFGEEKIGSVVRECVDDLLRREHLPTSRADIRSTRIGTGISSNRLLWQSKPWDITLDSSEASSSYQYFSKITSWIIGSLWTLQLCQQYRTRLLSLRDYIRYCVVSRVTRCLYNRCTSWLKRISFSSIRVFIQAALFRVFLPCRCIPDTSRLGKGIITTLLGQWQILWGQRDQPCFQRGVFTSTPSMISRWLSYHLRTSCCLMDFLPFFNNTETHKGAVVARWWKLLPAVCS